MKTGMSRFEKPVALLVQPHQDNREMYAEFLRHHGFEVLAFADAADALRVSPLASVVITEIRGTVDGAALVASLHADERTKRTPVIVLSASVLPHERARMEAAGCDDFLPMPCLPGKLLGHVRRLLISSTVEKATSTNSVIPVARRRRQA
jgi:CheY-like chemotaxis protein